jgi:large subunit ribosomal protein L21
MYAVIKTGGKQYRVAADEVVTIEKIAGDKGAQVEFTEVLMVGAGGEAKVGTPAVAGARVVAEVVEQSRAPKVIAFKKRRRKNSRRKRGHRQHQTLVRIKEIVGA